MTSNIKGPDRPRLPTPTGTGPEGGTPVGLPQALDRILAGGEGGTGRISARPGTGQDPPIGGPQSGRRADRMQDFVTQRDTRLSEARTALASGSSKLTDLLAAVTTPDRSGDPATALRRDPALRDRLSTALHNAGGPDRPGTADRTSVLMDHLLGSPGRPSPLAGQIPSQTLAHLQDVAARIPPGPDAGDRLRSLVSDTLFQRGLLPELMTLATDSGRSADLASAIFGLHSLLSGPPDRLPPDLAPLRDRAQQGLDDLIHALGLKST